MKKVFLPALLIAALFTHKASAQTNKAFAVTSENKGGYVWNVIREIDLSSGEVLRTLYNPSTDKNVTFEGAAGSKLSASYTSNTATVNGVAAAAYDAKQNRLYYAPMWGNDLRYFDLNSGELKVVINTDNNFSTGPRVDESNVVTRMAFASDGNGYALTNDGKQLIRFTTDAKPSITNLGELIDSKKNNGISVHNQCTSWGGDMIGDAFGNLYLFTYRNNVFKINVQTRIAEHIGIIKNLPAAFTTNGAVVDANGDIVVSSATSPDNYYRVNLSTLQATAIDKKDQTVFNASDLANGNLAYQKATTPVIKMNEVRGNDVISVYPNPAISQVFTVQFEKVPAGAYQVQLTDANGRQVISKSVNVVGVQNEKINLPKAVSAGLYLIKVTNNEGKAVYNDKIVVQ